MSIQSPSDTRNAYRSIHTFEGTKIETIQKTKIFFYFSRAQIMSSMFAGMGSKGVTRKRLDKHLEREHLSIYSWEPRPGWLQSLSHYCIRLRLRSVKQKCRLRENPAADDVRPHCRLVTRENPLVHLGRIYTPPFPPSLRSKVQATRTSEKKILRR